MVRSVDKPVGDLIPRSRRGDAPVRQERSPDAGPPTRRRSRAPAWWVLGFAVTALTTGVVFSQGLLLGSGLVLAGLSAHLFDPERPPFRQRDRRPQPEDRRPAT